MEKGWSLGSEFNTGRVRAGRELPGQREIHSPNKNSKVLILWIFSSTIFSRDQWETSLPCVSLIACTFSVSMWDGWRVFLFVCRLQFTPNGPLTTQKMLGPLLKADLNTEEHKSSASRPYNKVRRMEKIKQCKDLKIWLEMKTKRLRVGKCWCQCAEERTGVHPLLTSSPFYVCICCLLPLLQGIPSSVWCDVLFTAITEPRWLSYWSGSPHEKLLIFRPFECHMHLHPFKPHLSYTFWQCHRSLTNTQVFQQTTGILVVKITSHNNKTWAFSRAPEFRSHYYPTTSQSTNCLSVVDGWAQQMSLQGATAEMKIWEPSLVTSALANTPAVSDKSQLVSPSSEAIFFPFPWTKSSYHPNSS